MAEIGRIHALANNYFDRPDTMTFGNQAQRGSIEFLTPDRPQDFSGVNNAMAEARATEFLQAVERRAQAEGLSTVDAISVELTIQGLCPGFFPFC